MGWFDDKSKPQPPKKKRTPKEEVVICTHDWRLISKSYAPPQAGIKISELNIDQSLAEKVLLGVTTYLWECKICFKTRKELMLGSDEQQLPEICDNVDKFGMQQITVNGKVYAIARWVPENSPPVMR